MRRLTGLLAALLVGSAAGIVAATGPAAAAACSSGQGVTVVVGSSVACDANGGGTAADNLKGTGHSLTMVDRQPGFVCRVDGAPSSASCVNTPPADAYWGLFWSDGTSGTWTYASQGVGSLKVPAGGWVAMVFQNSESKTYPGVKPVSAAPAPAATKPAAKPSPRPTATPSAKATSRPKSPATATPGAKPAPGRSTSTPSATPTPGATPSASAGPTATPGASAPTTAAEQEDPTPESTDEIAPASAEADSPSDSGSLGWVAAVLAVALLAGMGAVLWRRKVAGGSS